MVFDTLPDSGIRILETLSDISSSIWVQLHLAHEGHLHCCYMKLPTTLGTGRQYKTKKYVNAAILGHEMNIHCTCTCIQLAFIMIGINCVTQKLRMQRPFQSTGTGGARWVIGLVHCITTPGWGKCPSPPFPLLSLQGRDGSCEN